MGINNKTRKLLWVKSGNRCAICKEKLVIKATEADDAAIIGEECHIHSEKEKGPRYNPDYPTEKLDSDENILILCPNHHTEVDTQINKYTEEKLRQIKQEHEKWVERRLTNKRYFTVIGLTLLSVIIFLAGYWGINRKGYSFSITVWDSDGKVVENAAIIAEGSELGRTNKNGQFQCELPGEMQKEELSILVRKDGFINWKTTYYPKNKKGAEVILEKEAD